MCTRRRPFIPALDAGKHSCNRAAPHSALSYTMTVNHEQFIVMRKEARSARTSQLTNGPRLSSDVEVVSLRDLKEMR